MRSRVIALLLTAAVIASGSQVGAEPVDQPAGGVRVGVAYEDITWHPGAGQSGFGERWRPYHAEDQGVETNMYARLMKPSEGVHMRLRTKVMVLDDGTKKMAVVSNDLLGTIQIFHRGVAQEIATDPGIAWDDLMIVGTHSESVPSNGSISPLIAAYADVFDEEFYRYVIERVVGAIRRADADLEPVRFAVGTTEVPGMIGTFVRDNLDLYLDDDLGVARFDRLDGTTKAVMLTYAGHFVLGGNNSRLISSDGPGYWERMVEAEVREQQPENPDVMAMYLTGPTGDSGVSGVGQPNLYAEGELKALRLAGPSMDLFSQLQPSTDFDIASAAIRLNPPPGEEIPHFPLLADAPIPFMVSHRIHTHVMKIGDLLLGGVPGEPVMALGRDFKETVKERFGVKHPFMLSHANDWTGYIYTPEQWHAGQGRSDQNAYGPNQGDYIVEKLIDLTHSIFDPSVTVDPGEGGLLQAVDDPYYDTAAAALGATGPVTGEIRDTAIVPNVVLTCDGLTEPRDVTRFEDTTFAWRGGNNAVDTPRVELQRATEDGGWTTVVRDDGYELQTWLEIYKVRASDPYLPGTTPGCNELVDQRWSAVFQPALDFPTGTYRFVAKGLFRWAPKMDEAYESISEPFEVSAADALQVEDLSLSTQGDGTTLLSFRVAYPNGREAWRYRPRHATTGRAEVLHDGALVGEATYSPSHGAFVLEVPPSLPLQELTIEVADGWGNTN